MDELISKREVLERYGISYGALYRWKRLGLIPEEWFLKKSTVTGQETFFRKENICPRVELILSRKEQLSLEELAEELAGTQKIRHARLRLVLENGFDTREYAIDELRSATITDGERSVSILDYLREVSL